MITRFQRPTTWSLLVVLTMLAGGSEGLHALPGCGHYIELPSGLIGVGISPDEDEEQQSGGGLNLRSPSPGRLSVVGAGQCPLCSFVAQAKQRGQVDSLLMFSAPFVRHALFERPRRVFYRVGACHPRAPPAG
jgi:hypothetical protein